MPHLVRIDDLDRSTIERLLDLANSLELRGTEGVPAILSGAIIGLVFGAPSLRTHSSFQAATMRLGGRVLDATGAHGLPYVAESLADVIRSVDALCQAIVVRHTWSPTPLEIAEVSRVPIINAGQMHGEHPTQALADLYTLRQVFGTLEHLVLGLVVDAPERREVTSLRRVLKLFPSITAHWFAAEDNVVPLEGPTRAVTELPEMAKSLAAVYVTPSTTSGATWARQVATQLRHSVAVNPELCLLHPLPRGAELPTDLDRHVRSAYFREAQNGLWVREAVLGWVLNLW